MAQGDILARINAAVCAFHAHSTQEPRSLYLSDKEHNELFLLLSSYGLIGKSASPPTNRGSRVTEFEGMTVFVLADDYRNHVSVS